MYLVAYILIWVGKTFRGLSSLSTCTIEGMTTRAGKASPKGLSIKESSVGNSPVNSLD